MSTGLPKPSDHQDSDHEGAVGPDLQESSARDVDKQDNSDSAETDQLFHDGRLPAMLVRASAGTGKTYRLTARLLQILLQGATPESILATTFTRKAAGEILERVLLTLANACDESNENALEDLRRQVGLKTLPRSACRRLLQNLIANIHRLRISTLDSLFTQLAKSFPFELQLPTNWRLTDEIEESWLSERAIDSVIASLDSSELTSLLSMLSKGETKRSISRELIQVIAGAYSVSRRSASDAWKSVGAPTQPDDADIRAAAAAFRMSEPPQPSVLRKFESIANALDARRFDELVGDRLVHNYAKAKLTNQEVKLGRSKLPDGLEDALGVLYSIARTHTLSLLALQNEATGSILSLFDSQISQLKSSTRTLSFDDVAVRLAACFESLDHQTLSRRMDGSIDHLLLDEFQDTSQVQWQVLRPIAVRSAESIDASEQEEDSGVVRSFFCVGDTKQAIYGWRGGVAEIFDTVENAIPETRPVEQNQSFRSSPVIMDFVNRVFRNLDRHSAAETDSTNHEADKATYEAAAIKQFCKSFPEHTAFKSSMPGFVRIETCWDGKPEVPQRELGDNSTDSGVESKRTSKPGNKSTSKERAQWCYEVAAQRIREIHEADDQSTIGVLTRTNAGVANMIYLLEGLGIESSQEGGNPLVDSAAVELVLSALMMAEHPSDGRWRFHVENSPLAGSEDLSPRSIRERITEHGLARTVFFLGSQLTDFCEARDRTRLRQLVQFATRYEPNETNRLRDFVRMVRIKRVERPQSTRVRVMTIHQSKGLEFDAVVLPELDGRMFGHTPFCVADAPDLSKPPVGISRYLSTDSWHFLESRWRKAFGQDAGARINEVICTLYVALTRARKALYLVNQPGKPQDKTVAALIRAALGCGQDASKPNQVIWEQGNPEWYKSQ